MKAIDTNIILRYFLNDDEKQTEKVKKLFIQTRINNEVLFVPCLVILELDWVLSSFYKMPRKDIIDLLLIIADFDILLLEYEPILKNTLISAKNNNHDLSDLFIGTIAKVNDCECTLTFDKNASKSPDFELLI